MLFRSSKYALDFFRDNKILFQDMMSSKNFNSPSTARLPATSTDWLLSLPNGNHHVIYRKVGNAAGATLTGLVAGAYDVKWYNPRTGGPLQSGSIASLSLSNGSQTLSYGTPPDTATLDWVVNIRKI